MPRTLNAETDSLNRLAESIRACVEKRQNLLSSTRGYQSEIYLVADGASRWIVKAPGRKLWARLAGGLLSPRREYQIYRRLEGIVGVPRCLGLLDGKYLVLEHLEAVPYRFATLEDRQDFFDRLRRLIDELHRRGIAHGDLKKKENLLVAQGRHPYVIDFGSAAVRRRGLGGCAFNVLRQIDDNAWLKLKYDNEMSRLSPEDAVYFHDTFGERALRAIRRTYLKLRWPAGAPVKRRRPPQLQGPAAAAVAPLVIIREILVVLASLLLIPTLWHALRRFWRRLRPKPRRPLCWGEPVAIQAADGSFLALGREPAARPTFRRRRIGPEELFELTPTTTPAAADEGLHLGVRVAVRAVVAQRYLTASNEAEGEVVALPAGAGPGEVFSLEPPEGHDAEEGAVCAESPLVIGVGGVGNGMRLRFAPHCDGGLVASMAPVNDWTVFRFYRPPRKLTASLGATVGCPGRSASDRVTNPSDGSVPGASEPAR